MKKKKYEQRKRNMNEEKEIWTNKKKYEQIKRNINKEKNNLNQTKRIMFFMNERKRREKRRYLRKKNS